MVQIFIKEEFAFICHTSCYHHHHHLYHIIRPNYQSNLTGTRYLFAECVVMGNRLSGLFVLPQLITVLDWMVVVGCLSGGGHCCSSLTGDVINCAGPE